MIHLPRLALAAGLVVGVGMSSAHAQGTTFNTDRKQMQADAVAARATWSRFTTLFGASTGDSFLVKHLFLEGKAPKQREELLWVRVTALDGETVIGRVANRPAVLKETREKDIVRIPAAKIMDWLVTKNRTSFAGGYSLRDAEPMRSMRHESDRANLPYRALDDDPVPLVLSGPKVAKDLAQFGKRAWNRIWVELKRNGLSEKALADRKTLFDASWTRRILPRPKIELLLSRPGKPGTKTLLLTAAHPQGFARGDLLYQIQTQTRSFFQADRGVRFEGLVFVRISEKGVPTYLVKTNQN